MQVKEGKKSQDIFVEGRLITLFLIPFSIFVVFKLIPIVIVPLQFLIFIYLVFLPLIALISMIYGRILIYMSSPRSDTNNFLIDYFSKIGYSIEPYVISSLLISVFSLIIGLFFSFFNDVNFYSLIKVTGFVVEIFLFLIFPSLSIFKKFRFKNELTTYFEIEDVGFRHEKRRTVIASPKGYGKSKLISTDLTKGMNKWNNKL